MKSPARLLSLIAARAKELRAAGVLRVELPELRLELSPVESTPAPQQTADGGSVRTIEMVEDPDPLNDPSTFGTTDGSLPGYKSKRRPQDVD
jgi:hypothetical protein